MEKKQKKAERSRKNRLKRRNEFERYTLENDLPFVLSFEAKRLRHHAQDQPAQEQDQQQMQQPEMNDSSMVDNLLNVDLSGLEW